jgi:hypothetical protein
MRIVSAALAGAPPDYDFLLAAALRQPSSTIETDSRKRRGTARGKLMTAFRNPATSGPAQGPPRMHQTPRTRAAPAASGNASPAGLNIFRSAP